MSYVLHPIFSNVLVDVTKFKNVKSTNQAYMYTFKNGKWEGSGKFCYSPPMPDNEYFDRYCKYNSSNGYYYYRGLELY